MRTLRTFLEPGDPPPQKRKAGRPPQPGGPGGKSHGYVDDPVVLPPVPAAPSPEAAVEMVERDATELDAICATALASGFGVRTATRLILAEHGPASKNARVKGIVYDRRTVYTALKRISDEWEADFKEFAHTERSKQVERLRQDLARQRAKANPSFQAIRGHEELLGRILGTLQPIRVEVDVMSTLKVSIAAVLVDLTDSEKDAMVAEQMELEDRARRPILTDGMSVAAE